MSILVSALSSVYIFKVIFEITRSKKLSVFFSVSPYIIVQSGEILGNITNLQWVLGLTTLILILDIYYFPADSKKITFLKSSFVFVFGLTGPFLIIFAPVVIALFVLSAEKYRFRVIFPTICILASQAIQSLVFIFASHRAVVGVSIPWMQRFLTDFMVQGFFFFKHFPQWAKLLFGITMLILIFTTLCAMKKNRFLPIMLLMLSVTFWILAILRIKNPDVLINPINAGARYYFLPYVFMFWSLLLCFREVPRRWKFAPTIPLLLMLLAGLATFQIKAYPRWKMSQSGPDTWEVTAPPGWRATIHVRD
jgi:hypothetical protein